MKWGLACLIVLLCAYPAISQEQPEPQGRPVAVEPTIVLNEANVGLGDTITFTVTYPKIADQGNNSGARIQVLCYQGEVLVYGEAGPATQGFKLGGSGSRWLYEFPNYGASCVADLFYWSYRKGRQAFNWLASTDFEASGAGSR